MVMEIKVNVFETEKDGLPNMDELVGRVAFIFDGNIVNGYPLKGSEDEEYTEFDWEADSDVGRHGVFSGVKKYVVFDKPMWQL